MSYLFMLEPRKLLILNLTLFIIDCKCHGSVVFTYSYRFSCIALNIIQYVCVVDGNLVIAAATQYDLAVTLLVSN